MEGDVIAGNGRAAWAGAALDSRRVEGGELFFALAGETTDGHRFVGDALARGAAGAVVHRELEPGAVAGSAPGVHPGAAVIRVADTYAGLHALVRRLRRDLPEVLVGITGSVGKTTTKELASAVLAERFRTARSPGNLNNLYGFPLAFLGIPDDTEVMVAELGMSVPGELGRVSALARPDGAVLTNVRPAHLENFPDLDAIAEAKAEIFRGLPSGPGAFVVANRDDPQVVRVTERWASARPADSARVIWYGLEDRPETQVRGRDVRAAVLADGRIGIRFTLEIRPSSPSASVSASASGSEAVEIAVEVELPLHGTYNAGNALAAAAVAHALGLGPEEIRRGLARVRSAEHRGAVHRLEDGIVLVDDSYNSNPDALAQALESAVELAAAGAETEEPAGTGRRVAVLGDMLELGREAGRFHREAGRRAAELGFGPVVGVGALAEELVVGAREAGAEAVHLEDAAAAAEWTDRSLHPRDLVLVKGSRGVGLDRVVERMLAARGAAPARGDA